ncbi:MAG: DUF1292 domain-containing protein [Lachnospiraceae bacterium]|nr:DUF1292 domain-containing protein [Lachnospiraceae bacterium]
MNEKEPTISFVTEDNETVLFTVISETRVGGVNYLLVVENETDEETYILKETSEEGSDIVYEIVSDDKELRIIADVFEELLEDVRIE